MTSSFSEESINARTRDVEEASEYMSSLSSNNALPQADDEEEIEMFDFLADCYVLMVKGRLDPDKIKALNSINPDDPWDKHVEKELGITPQLRRLIAEMPGEIREIVSCLKRATASDDVEISPRSSQHDVNEEATQDEAKLFDWLAASRSQDMSEEDYDDYDEEELFNWLAECYVGMVKGRLTPQRIETLNGLNSIAGGGGDPSQSETWDEHVEQELSITSELKLELVEKQGTTKEIVSWLKTRSAC